MNIGLMILEWAHDNNINIAQVNIIENPKEITMYKKDSTGDAIIDKIYRPTRDNMSDEDIFKEVIMLYESI